jgi:hypothetical protein
MPPGRQRLWRTRLGRGGRVGRPNPGRPASVGTSSRPARGAGSDVARGPSGRARQTAVVVLDVMLYRGPAITPDKKVAFLLGQRGAYEGWLITPPYITRLAMVNAKSWFQSDRTPAGPASSYSPGCRFTWRIVIAQLGSLDGAADRKCSRRNRGQSGSAEHSEPPTWTAKRLIDL